MAFTVEQITQNIITQLKLLDPAVSAEVGTPERKIIEATAEMIASSQVDFTVLNQQHDLDAMAGGRLDAYLSIFNFGRQRAVPAYGTVTFSRTTPATQAIIIPAGTQVAANINDDLFPNINYVTLQTVILEEGQLSVSAPIQCTVAGTIGNIDAGQIVGFGSLKAINGITSVTNDMPVIGGMDAESDSQYKVRFKNTFLRNISGTTDMFLALAVGTTGVTKATVVGPMSRYQEYIQIPTGNDPNQNNPVYDPNGTLWPNKRTSEKSTIPYSKYTYKNNYYLTNTTLDPATAIFFRPEVDFIFNSPPIDRTTQLPTTPETTPNVTFLNPYDSVTNPIGNRNLTEGDIVLLEHAYSSINSRNDPSFGILNAVDVFIDGRNIISGSSMEVVPPSSHNLQNTNSVLWTYQKTTTPKVINFRRAIDSAECTVGNRIQPLYWQPVVELPDSIQVGNSTYYKANYYRSSNATYYNKYDPNTNTYSRPAHYALAIEVNSNHGTVRSRNGIEWFLVGNNYLRGRRSSDTGDTYTGDFINSQVGVEFAVNNYLYDRNVSDLQAVCEKNKQVTQDVLVHQAKYRYFRPMVTLMYTMGATRSVVDASIISALESFFRNHYFGSTVQLSDILQTIHSVPGVDNVRWTNDSPSGNKLEEVGADGRTLSGGPFWITTDFYLQDNELPASPSNNKITIVVRAQNTWGN